LSAQFLHNLVRPENAPHNRQSWGSKRCIKFVQMFNMDLA
jgi:hypothetical protein